MEPTALPIADFELERKRLGLSLEGADKQVVWRGDDLMIALSWPDGRTAELPMGKTASAIAMRLRDNVPVH